MFISNTFIWPIKLSDTQRITTTYKINRKIQRDYRNYFLLWSHLACSRFPSAFIFPLRLIYSWIQSLHSNMVVILVVAFYFIRRIIPVDLNSIPFFRCTYVSFTFQWINSQSSSQKMRNKNPIYPWSKVDKTMIPVPKRSCLRIYERKECYWRVHDSYSRCAV